MTVIKDTQDGVVERRIIVKGWKGATRVEFTDTSALYSDASVEFERKRIGEEGLEEWQPHIAEVIVEERVVTPWVEAERHTENGS